MIVSRCSLKLVNSLARLVIILSRLLFGSSYFIMEWVFGKIVFKFNVGKKNHPYSYLDFRKGISFVILYLLEIQAPLRTASHLFSPVSSALKGHASSLAPPVHFSLLHGTLLPGPPLYSCGFTCLIGWTWGQWRSHTKL